MNLHRHRIALLVVMHLLLFGTISSRAEESAEFGIFPMSGPEGILLVLQGPSLHPSSASLHDGWIGYHIYRRGEGDSGFVRITAKPVSRVGSLQDFERFAGGPIDGLERFVGLSSKEELWQHLIRNDSSVMILGLFSRTFFEALGLLQWDRNVVKGKQYSYRITRVNGSGGESAPSEVVDATFGTPPFRLSGPLDPAATNTKAGIELVWKGNPEDSGGISYNVYRTPDIEGAFLRINRYSVILAPDSASGEPLGRYLDSTASQGHTYYYAVVSSDYAGNESQHNNVVSIYVTDLQAPPIPQSVFAEPSDMGIVLTWDRVDDPAIAGYWIYRSLDPDSNYQRITESLLPYDTGWYIDRSATASDRLFYRVTAVDHAGNESPKSARALSLYENYVLPLPPQEVRAELAGTGIRLTWRRNEEPDLQGYYLFRADSYGGELTQIAPLIAPDTLAYVDTSHYLSSRGEYWYLMQAVNHTGITSQYSVPVAMSPSVTEQPEPVRAFWGYYDNYAVQLFWRFPDDNMANGFNLYRSTEQDSANWSLLISRPLDRERSEYRDTSVVGNGRYRYRIRSVDLEGRESELSHTVEVGTFATVASPPGGLRIVRGIVPELTWDRSLLEEVTGYRVYRRVEGQQISLLTAQPIATNLAGFSDATAPVGRKCYYSISSIDRWGRESERSPEIEFLVR